MVVVTGNFDSQRTLQVIGQHFGPLPGRAVAAPARLALPVSALTIHVRWLALACPLVNATDDSDIALIPLANVLTAEPHGRLYQALVVADKSLGVLAQPLSFRRGGYLLFAAPLCGGQSMDEARQILAEQLEGLARQPIRDEEMQRFQSDCKPIKAQLMSNPVALADSLSENVALGDWQLVLKAHEGVTRLSTSEVQRQAQAHFQAGRRLVAELHPADAQQTRVSAAPPAALLPSTQMQATALPDAVDLAAFAAKVASIESSIQRSSLDNGLKLALRPLPATGRPLPGTPALRPQRQSQSRGRPGAVRRRTHPRAQATGLAPATELRPGRQHSRRNAAPALLRHRNDQCLERAQPGVRECHAGAGQRRRR